MASFAAREFSPIFNRSRFCFALPCVPPQPEKFVEIPKIPLPRQRLRDWYGKPENRGVMEEHATRWDDEPAADEAKAN